MIVTGENLLGIVRQYNICPERLYDQFSIALELDSCILYPRPTIEPVRYGLQETESLFTEHRLATGELELASKAAVLACSSDIIRMPPGYMGLLQTKGSLARLFVSVHCSDSQIEPGYTGKVTFELVNHAPFTVALPLNSRVAQIYIFKCSDDNDLEVYQGRYQNAVKPTVSRLSSQ